MPYTRPVPRYNYAGRPGYSAMVFTCNGRTYDTSEMIPFETGDPSTPVVFVTRDWSCVFVVTVDPWKGAGVHQADKVEVKVVVARYGLPDLLRAV